MNVKNINFVAIIGGDPLRDFKRLDDFMEDAWSNDKLPFLFYHLCYNEKLLSTNDRTNIKIMTLGDYWAIERGVPFYSIPASWVINKADYLIFVMDGADSTKRALIKARARGKHGSVIKIKF